MCWIRFLKFCFLSNDLFFVIYLNKQLFKIARIDLLLKSVKIKTGIISTETL